MASMRFSAVEQRCIAESNKYMAIDRPWHHRSLVCLCPLASSNRCGIDMCEQLPCIGMVRSLRWSKGRIVIYVILCYIYIYIRMYIYFVLCFYTLWSEGWKAFLRRGRWSATICDMCSVSNVLWFTHHATARQNTSGRCPSKAIPSVKVLRLGMRRPYTASTCRISVCPVSWQTNFKFIALWHGMVQWLLDHFTKSVLGGF